MNYSAVGMQNQLVELTIVEKIFGSTWVKYHKNTDVDGINANIQVKYSKLHSINIRIIDIKMHIYSNITRLDEHVSMGYNTKNVLFSNIHTIIYKIRKDATCYEDHSQENGL